MVKEMVSFKKILAVLVATSMGSLSLVGCGSPTNKETPANVPVAESTVESSVESVEESTTDHTDNSTDKIIAYGVMDPQVSAQQIIADKKGFFKEEGLNIENKLLEGSSEIASLIAGNTAQISFESNYTDISLSANGVKIKMLAPVANIGGTQCVVARKGLEINSAKDFEGKKIGMASGAGILIAIREMCTELGVDISKITFVTLDPSDQVSALARGDIDFLAGWEPWVGKAIEQGGTLMFSGVESYLPDKTGAVDWLNFHTTVQVTGKFYDENYDSVVKMMKALAKATDFINDNRDEAAGIISEVIQVDKAEVLSIMSKNVYSIEFNQDFVDATNTMAAFMKDMNNISSVPAFSDFGDSSALKEAVPSLVTE